MCGRYAASRSPEDLVEEFEVERVEIRERLQPDWNVAPTKDVYAVLTRRDRRAPEDEPPHRQLRVLRWGLVPSWAKDPSIGNRMINARVETLDTKPAFRRALAGRRCLLPADGYYEWYPTEQGRKQPFYLHPRADGSLALAGLYEFWRDPTKDSEDPTAWLTTCVIITAEAADELGHIHDRMPMVVARADWERWLDPSRQDAPAAKQLLLPASSTQLEAYPVSTDVNSPRNNGPGLVSPLPPEQADAPDAVS